MSPVQPLKTGQEQDKPFSRHRSLFSLSVRRVSRYVYIRMHKVQRAYSVYCTCVCEGHADTGRQYMRYTHPLPRLLMLSHSSGLCIHAYMHPCTVRTSTISHDDHSSSLRASPNERAPCYHCLLQDRRHRTLGTYDGAATGLPVFRWWCPLHYCCTTLHDHRPRIVLLLSSVSCHRCWRLSNDDHS